MGLQTRNLTLVAIGTAGDEPANSLQPPLADGVHLRWAFSRALGFPWYGYYLFRRAHRAGTPQFLSSHTGTLPKGPTGAITLDTPLGLVSSDQPLLLTEDFAPTGVTEFDLRGRGFLRFTLPPNASARRMEVTLGFRDRSDWPPKVCVDFGGRPHGAGPNPRREEDPDTRQMVTFEAKQKDGTPRPNTEIQSMRIGSANPTGLSCEWGIDITLPTASSYVEVTLSAAVAAATVETYNEDGSSAGRKTTSDPKSPKDRGPETLRIDGGAITRVAVRADQGKTLLNRFCWQPIPVTTIQLTGFAGRTPVTHIVASGRPGQVKSASLAFDGLDAAEMNGGAAALIDIGIVMLSDEATIGWALVPDFPAPMRLPLTHPDYPCTPGAAEDIDQARAVAAQRIRYGIPSQYTTPTARPVSGTVSVTSGSPIVTGAGTNWTADLVGTVLRVAGDKTAYVVLTVLAPTRLVVSRSYTGATGAGKSYGIADDRFGQLYEQLVHLVAGGAAAGPMAGRTVPGPVASQGTVAVTSGSAVVTGTGTAWSAEFAGFALRTARDATTYVIAQVQSPTQLTLERVYAGESGSALSCGIFPRMRGGAAANVPVMAQQIPLDLVLLSALHPAFAQMAGLYWVDRTAQAGVAYDYLLVADHDGRGALDATRILALIAQSGFQTLDGFIAYNRRASPSPALAPPPAPRAYALPDAAIGATDVGLRWDPGLTDEGTLVPEHAIMYHLWRADLGASEPAAPPPGTQYQLRSTRGPIIITTSPNAAPPQRRPDWPPFALYAVEGGLADGWYSYRLSGIDIFGRHSALSPPALWFQWAPVPEPRPPYYQDPPGDRTIHPFAVNVPDFMPPPPPTGVEAYALDAMDPLVVKDAAYTAWWNDLQRARWYQALTGDQKQNLVGLRVRWRWTQAQLLQAPDAREFRIYYQPGQLNSLLGRVVNVLAVGTTESEVATDIPNTRPANAYVGAWLRVGADTFTIISSNAGPALTARVRNIGARDDVRPRVNAPCTVALPLFYAEGRVTVARGSPTITGEGTAWKTELTGRLFQIVGDLETYTVARVDSPTQLVLARAYAGTEDANAKSYGIRHPLYIDYSIAANWDRRHFVVPFTDARFVRQTLSDGRPIRTYEAFLPLADGTLKEGLPLAPTLADPIAYAHVGVSAADDKAYARDARTAGSLSGRPGNEGRVAPPMAVFRVRREKPGAPASAPYPEVVFGTRADANGRSFFTFRWRPTTALRTHVFRALDGAIFNADWARRPRPALDPVNSAADRALFPTEPRWNAAKLGAVAAELNPLNALKTGGVSRDEAVTRYRALSNDALRVLAGLPDNESAFSQISVEPLDPNDPANADRRGPDDPDGYTPSAELRAYVDALDGRTANRYFYRAAHVDAAGNRGPMSLAGAPVRLPNVVPPRAPVLTRVVSGDRSVTLYWASGREPGIREYLVYRATSEAAARDVRLMTCVHTVTATPSGVTASNEVSWMDVVPALQSLYYRLVTRDEAGLVSDPSAVITARAYDESLPAVPTPTAVWFVQTPPTVRITWTTPDDTVLERRADVGMIWMRITGWLAPGAHSVDDVVGSTTGWVYRLRARKVTGAIAAGAEVRL